MAGLAGSTEVEGAIQRALVRSQARETLSRLTRNRGAMFALVFMVLLVFLALAGPIFTPYDPIRIVQQDQLQPPSVRHPLGTDNLGRDILTRIVYGASISLQVGLIAVGIAASIGVALGLPSGFYGGWVDLITQRIIDIMLAFPSILLALGIVGVLGPNLSNVMIAVGISAVPAYARLVRGSVLAAKENVYVDSARVIGCSDVRIMVRHILPNVVTPVIVLGTLGIAGAILSAASLSFLGMGAQPPTPEWGAMLGEGRNYMRVSWWMTTFPGLAIMATVLAINMLGDGLRDALDPRLKI